ncbi:MAG: Gfo/Idh/MocA family oxidoreductase [Lentisphaerae bacterium]|nr:Gfo/Idh/MocA family oxidoreductase [Lentisphaerota bacterium]MBT4820118.1 Gfo/Idh/MocA family oxidoreductase [Lentisphaerota bacterium]MBT5606231.1 Gfo/Idh/MocA family oxidoreductase [Lentisphaerota bacterium]MBT7058644.1 Gfo/Idh/MocA family oxidoreductase [Lentisphaerota bacterium]MBT7848744.1 Gfo/Idh/MocA family oxidoreductase [Lentisphaerota bacterium]
MASDIRVGIVGCGKIAERNHLPGFLGVQGTTVTALCDIVPERMKEKQAEFAPDAALISDYHELYASGLVDAVAICTPNDLHCPMTLAACEAGLHVLCEKPMAASLAEATEMIEAAKAAGVVLQINQSMRYNATYQTLVNLVHGGAIGEPFHVRCIRGGAGTPNKGWSPGADWFVQSKRQGGLLLDIGIHMADLLRMIMGDADKVAGLVDTRLPDIDVPDNVNALYRFKNGGTGMLELSWTLPGGAGFLEVYGTTGRLRMGFTEQSIELTALGDGDPVTSYPTPVPCANSQFVFRQAILGEAPSLTPGEYGRRALALCLAALESSGKSEFVPVPLFDGDNDIC